MIRLSRGEAGQRLAGALAPLVEGEAVVVAVSCGGARVGDPISAALSAPLDVMMTARLEVPGRPRSVFGAVAMGVAQVDQETVDRLGLPSAYVDQLVKLALEEARVGTVACRGTNPPALLRGRTVVLVDDATAEPLLLEATINGIRTAGPRRLIYAAPLWPASVRDRILPRVDQAVVLHGPEEAGQVLLTDGTFAQPTRVELQAMIRRSRAVPSV